MKSWWKKTQRLLAIGVQAKECFGVHNSLDTKKKAQFVRRELGPTGVWKTSMRL